MKSQFGAGAFPGMAIRWVMVLSVSCLVPTPSSAQNTAPARSPAQVLGEYRKIDAEGGRLTDGGWYQASRFFVEPGRPPIRYVVAVMEGEVSDGGRVSGNRARVSYRCSAIGQIDSSGRFTSLVAPHLIDPSGRPLKDSGAPPVRGPAPLLRVYDLVLTDTHWEFGPGREELREVKGAPEWRIETFEAEPWVTIDAAIRYLTRLREESSSASVKANADKSIATLRRILHESAASH